MDDFLEDEQIETNTNIGNDNSFKILDNIQKVLKRPNRAIGDIALSEHDIFVLEDSKISQKTCLYNPGLNKIIREVIDNSVDEHIRTNGEYATKIDLTINFETGEWSVSDNGRGLPIIEVDNVDGSKILLPEAAWCLLNAGSNFDDEADNATMGQNGEGVALTNIFSKKFRGETTNV